MSNLSEYESKLIGYLKLYEKDLPLTALELFKKINTIDPVDIMSSRSNISKIAKNLTKMVKKGLIGSKYTTVRGNNFVSKYFLIKEKLLNEEVAIKNDVIPLVVKKRYMMPATSARFIDVNYGDEGILQCPVCVENYLHQGTVHIIHRNFEDMDGKILSIDVNNNITKQEIKDKDIVGRRDALYIGFFCEKCEKTYSLEIYQHKGNTCISWVELNINLGGKSMNKLLKIQEEIQKKQEELNVERMIIFNNLKLGEKYKVRSTLKELESQGFQDDDIYMVRSHSSEEEVSLKVKLIKLSIEIKHDDSIMFIIIGREDMTGLNVSLQLEDFIL